MASEFKSNLTIFSHGGKNYMGHVINFAAGEKVNVPGVGDINASSAYYAVIAPCEYELDLETIEGGNSHVKFKKIMPLLPSNLYNGDKDKLYFAFPKATTVLSNATGVSIDGTLVNAYTVMTGTKLS